MDPIQFSLSCLPKGKGRPRATVRGDHASVYTDAKTRAFEAGISDAARLVMAGRPALAGALSVSLRFRMPVPKSAPKWQRLGMAAGEIPHVSKSDLDNMVKAVLDGMAAHSRAPKVPIVFVNDSQIVRLFATKVYAEKPGIDVRVEPLGEPQTEQVAA